MIYGNNRLEILKYDVKIKSMREALGELLPSSDQTHALPLQSDTEKGV